jgi:hypothetical protein
MHLILIVAVHLLASSVATRFIAPRRIRIGRGRAGRPERSNAQGIQFQCAE